MTSVCQPTTEFDTAQHADPVDVWRERMATTYDISVPDRARARFRVSFRAWSLGTVLFTGGSFTEQVFRRDAAMVRRDQLDHYGLFAQGQGDRISNAGGRERIIRSGDLQFFDMAQEEMSVARAGTSGTMLLSRHFVDDLIPNAASHHGAVLQDGAARILAGYILDVAKHFSTAPPAAISSIAGASVELARGCLSAALNNDASLPQQAYQMATRRRIEQYIDAHLGDATLGADGIQVEFGLSRSALYRLFESSHGVGRFIKHRRLNRIRTILFENRDPRTLAALASDFGFQSGAHFSREFSRHFGCSPSDLRAGRSLSVPQHGRDQTIDALYRSLNA